MVPDKPERERVVLERILSLKQLLKEDRGGPLELHELGICYYHLANYRQAAEYLGRLCETYPDYVEIGAVFALRGLCLLQEEEYATAESILQERLAKYPNDARLLSMLAHVCYRTGRESEAIDLHRRILRIDPDNVNSLNSLGYLLALRGSDADQQEAYDCLRRAVAARPEHPAYLDSFGVFLARRGDRERARRAFEKALQRAPENGEILEHVRSLLSGT